MSYLNYFYTLNELFKFLFRKNGYSSLNSPMYIFYHDIIADVTFTVKT